jgi:hypothetical protein
VEKKQLQELQRLAERKGFILEYMDDPKAYDQEGKFVLEGANDSEEDDYLYFKTEEGVRRFLEAIPDAPIDWSEKPQEDLGED